MTTHTPPGDGTPPEAKTPFGPYLLSDRIGAGGMGSVWRAWDSRLRRWVALKRINPGMKAEDRKRFIREAQTAAGLHHPNLITIHDVGEHEGEPFLVMELVQGKPFDPRTGLDGAVEILRKVALGLAEAHRHGIVHRDLKPENILIDKDGEPRIVDFGLAVWMDDRTKLTQPGVVIGTPNYMAPEQLSLSGDPIGPASDVYALGVILYQALMGTLPFEAKTLPALLRKILDSEPVEPVGPPDLVTICHKAIDKEPSRRFPSADAFAADLRRYQAGEPIEARPLSTLGRGLRGLRRKWRGVAVAVAVMVTVVAGGIAWRASKDRGRLEHQGRIQERIRPLAALIQETRPLFYVPGADLPVRLKKLRQALLDDAMLAEDREAAQTAELWTTLGVGWFLVGDEFRAEAALLKARKIDPTDGEAAFYLGRIYLDRSLQFNFVAKHQSTEDRRTQERRWAEAAVRCLAESANHWGRASAMDRDVAQAYETFARRDVAKAKTLCEEGLRKYGDVLGTEEFLMLHARGYMNEPSRAEVYLTQALQRRPHFAWGSFMRGVARSNSGNPRGAETDFTDCIRLNTHYAEAYEQRGIARKTLGAVDRALEDYTEAIRLEPSEPRYRYNRAIAYRAKGDHDSALRDFSRTIEFHPQFADAFLGMGISYQALGDVEKALENYRKAELADPGLAVASYNIGNLLLEKGDTQTAIDKFTEAVRKDASYAEAFCNRGITRVKTGDLDGGLADYNEALRLKPELATALIWRGALRQDTGDLKGAVEDFKKALQCAPPDWPERPRVRAELDRLLKTLDDGQ